MCYNSSMNVHELSFYSQFQCIMGNCPVTCCHGWRISLDDETLQKYRSAAGIRGLCLRSRLTKKNGAAVIKHSKGNCPFLTKERLCKIQLSLGEDYLSDVCRIFPRHRINYGLFAEELLFLACPEAVRLFLDNLDHLYYNPVEREVSYAKSGTNDDTDYLLELLEIRHALTAQIMGTSLPLPMLYAGLRSYAKALQQSYLSSYSLENSTDNDSLSDRHLNHHFLDKSSRTKAYADLSVHLDQAAVPFAIPHRITYEMLTSGFYHLFLKITSPLLYDLCRLYLKKFHGLTAERGDAQIKALKDLLHRSHPNAARILRGYLTYYLLGDFLITYEDYSFVRCITIGIMHTHLLELFLALFYEKNHRLREDDIIQIITVYTRRGKHNDLLEEQMYQKLKHIP